MVTRRGLLGGVTTAIATATAGCSGLTGEREVRSELVYSTDVNPTETITDVTLYLPVPVLDEAVVIEDRIDDGAFEPDGWSLAIADTDHGPMLEVNTDEMRPRDRPYDAWVDWTVDEEIDTREAMANAPTLQPKDDVEAVACDFPHPDEWDDQIRCYTYAGRFYGEYEPEGAEVAVSASLWGDNSWFNGGWTGNSYTDDLHGFVDGTGWTTGRGSFREGVGNY